MAEAQQLQVSDESRDLDREHEQVVRVVPRAARHRPDGQPGRADRDLWPFGVG